MSDEIRISFDGLSDVTAAIDRLKTQIDAATRRATEQGGELIRNLAVSNFSGSHPIGFSHVGGPKPNTVTGNLQRSIRTQPVVQMGQGKYSITVGPTAKYGRIIELGGRITPKNGEFLSFMLNGRFRRVREVTIPPYPYFAPAYRSAITKLPDIFQSAWKRALTDGG